MIPFCLEDAAAAAEVEAVAPVATSSSSSMEVVNRGLSRSFGISVNLNIRVLLNDSKMNDVHEFVHFFGERERLPFTFNER